MTLTPEEAFNIKSNIEEHARSIDELKRSTSSVVSALGENVTAIRENTTIVNDMLLELRERDVRDEYQKKEISEIHGHIRRVEKAMEDNKLEYKDPLDKLIRSQKFNAAIYESITSTWGKMIAIAFIVMFASWLGLDIKQLLGK